MVNETNIENPNISVKFLSAISKVVPTFDLGGMKILFHYLNVNLLFHTLLNK